MRIAFIDDNEQEQNQALPLFFKGFKEINVPVARLDLFRNAQSFLDLWIIGSYDLIIIDILIGEESGIDLAHEIRKKSEDVRIVFSSNSNEYACESYSVNASYYIQKPVTIESVRKMIHRLNLADYEQRRFIVLPDGQHLILRSIIYTEYSNHLILIYLKHCDPIKVWMSQKELAGLLQPYDYFLSCNSGNFINMYEVRKWETSFFTMKNGSTIPVSRRKIKEVDNQYHSFLFHTMRKELHSH